METSFCELRTKIVVNLVDGRKLGNVIDLVFDQSTSKVLGIVVPCTKSVWQIFKNQQDIFIPYHNICRIGEDTILVELTPSLPPPVTTSQNNNTTAQETKYMYYNEK